MNMNTVEWQNIAAFVLEIFVKLLWVIILYFCYYFALNCLSECGYQKNIFRVNIYISVVGVYFFKYILPLSPPPLVLYFFVVILLLFFLIYFFYGKRDIAATQKITHVL